jgi:hypothetical protein
MVQLLEDVMVPGMNEVVNFEMDTDHPLRGPMEVEVSTRAEAVN